MLPPRHVKQLKCIFLNCFSCCTIAQRKAPCLLPHAWACRHSQTISATIIDRRKKRESMPSLKPSEDKQFCPANFLLHHWRPKVLLKYEATGGLILSMFPLIKVSPYVSKIWVKHRWHYRLLRGKCITKTNCDFWEVQYYLIQQNNR